MNESNHSQAECLNRRQRVPRQVRRDLGSRPPTTTHPSDIGPAGTGKMSPFDDVPRMSDYLLEVDPVI